MPGGAANKAGNRYERRWTVLKLFDVLTGDADYIEIEALGEEDHGAEFVLLRDGTLEWHQGLRIHRNTSNVRYRQPSTVGREAGNSWPASASAQESRDDSCVVYDSDVPGPDRTSGDGNGNTSPGSRRRRMARYSVAFLAALIVIAGVVMAADRAWSPSGEPEYFRTGPGAGIESLCGNKVPLDGLVSTQADVFTNVSQWSQISLDGRSVYVMKGTFNGAIYHWVISDFNAYGIPNFKGTPGAAHIHWWVKGVKSLYCTISFFNSPPADLAQEGTRQVSTMAVPASIDGKPAFIQVCAWYKLEKTRKRCWPPS